MFGPILELAVTPASDVRTRSRTEIIIFCTIIPDDVSAFLRRRPP